MISPSRKRTAVGLSLLLTLGVCAPAWAQKATLAPAPYQTILNNAGQIVSGACVWTYVAGTTTPATTWSDVNQANPNANPVIADSAGRILIYLAPGNSYKFTVEQACTPPAHGAVIRTQDNIASVPPNATTVDIPTATAGETINAGQCAYLSDGSGSRTAGLWYRCDSTFDYASSVAEIGIAISQILAGASGTVRIAGSVTGLSALTVGAAYYVNTAGTFSTTIPTNMRLIGRADTATSLVVAGNPPSPGTPCITVASPATGTQNNFNPGIVGPCTIVRLTNVSLLTITGLVPGFDGQIVKLYAIGVGEVDLVHSSGSSGASQRLFNIAQSAPTPLLGGNVTLAYAEYVYDLPFAVWRLVNHEQGSWITPATPTFGGNGGQTWTGVTVNTNKYKLRGRDLTVAFDFQGTVGGTASTQLFFSIPFTVNTTTLWPYNNNLTTFAQLQATSGGSNILLFKDATVSGNWAAGATRTFGAFVVEVQ